MLAVSAPSKPIWSIFACAAGLHPSRIHVGGYCCPDPCRSPSGKRACRRILQSAPGSGFHLSVIRRYNPISISGRASDTLEKQAPAVFQSNEGNKYRKDYTK